MAEKAKANASPELAALQTRLQEKEETLRKHQRREEDLQSACARLESEVQQLRTDLAKCQQACQQLTEQLSAVPKSAPREKLAIATPGPIPTKVGEFPEQLREAAHAARLGSLGTLAAHLAHELNQPLTAIAGFAHAGQLLAGDTLDRQEVFRLFDRIAAQANRAGELIRRIRRFAVRGEPERTLIDINETVQDALRLIEWELQKHQVQTRLQLADDLPSVLADRVQIVQVLLNLMSNAIEAMRSTPVELRVLTIATQATESEVHASVSDAGSGISVEVIRHLFEAFRTTRPDGLGLGLALSREIVQAHNGRLWVKSNPERGTTFHLALLLSQP